MERRDVKQDSGEVVEGYVVDIACLRKYSRESGPERARAHSKECALMGHCVESGYALVDDEGIVALLDSAATPLVMQAIGESSRRQGIKLQVRRKREGQEMQTFEVQELGED